MGRDISTFRRRDSSLKPQAQVLVICEDTKSCKSYLEDAKAHFRANALIEIVNVGHTDPRGIVEKAIERKAKYDRLYCVIDRDTHPTFDEAVNLARSCAKVSMIVSHPCYEFWLYLHFQYSRKAYMRSGGASPGQQMLRALKQLEGMAEYDKGKVHNLFQVLLPRLPQAILNAEKAAAEAKEVGEPNPSTGIHLLLEEFESLGQPKKL
jgi:hypothetical protein